MTEAKGSDVRAALDKLTCRGCADGWPIDESYSRQCGKLTHVNPKDSFYISKHISKADEIIALFEARVQAAVVEVRGKVVAYIREHYHVFRSDEFAREVENVVRALSIPTDAYDAMLLRARIEGHDECCPDVNCPEPECEIRIRISRQLAVLTQPAEVEAKDKP